MTTIYIQRLYISSVVFAFIEYSSYRLTFVFSRFNCLWCRQPAMIFQQSFTEEAKQSLVRNWPSSLLTLPSVRSGSQRLFFSFRVLSSSSLMPRYSSNTRAMHLLTRRFRLFSPSSSYDLLNRCNKIDNLIEFCVFFLPSSSRIFFHRKLHILFDIVPNIYFITVIVYIENDW